MGNRKAQSEMAKKQNMEQYQAVEQNKCVMGGPHNWVPVLTVPCFYPESPDTHDMVRIVVMCSKCRTMETHQVVVLKNSADMSDEVKKKLLEDIAAAKARELAMRKQMEEKATVSAKIPLNQEQNTPANTEPSQNEEVQAPNSNELVTN